MASFCYAALLWGLMAIGGYTQASQFSFPGNSAWKEQQALRHFQQGLEEMNRQPLAAEQSFRKAIPIWHELTKTSPNEPKHRHNLAAV